MKTFFQLREEISKQFMNESKITYHEDGWKQKLNNHSKHEVDYDTGEGGSHTAVHSGKQMIHHNDEDHYHDDGSHDEDYIHRDVKRNHPDHSAADHKAFTKDIIRAEKAHRKAHGDRYNFS